MSKILKIHYSSHRNITFVGDEDFDAPDDWDDYSEAEKSKYLDEVAEEWLWENVEVYAEVVDE